MKEKKNPPQKKAAYATVKVSKRNPTTNYPRDSHRAFCNRCFYGNHRRCPITGGNSTKRCRL